MSHVGRNLGQYFSGFFEGIRTALPTAAYTKGLVLAEEFNQYVDSFASASPHVLHHVYEWGQCGVADARLFRLQVTPDGATGAWITYELLESQTPNPNGDMFPMKAEVMESGEMVTFTTDKPVPMELDDGLIFRVGQFTFKPGGKDTTGAFRDIFIDYFRNIRLVPVLTLPHNINNKSGMAQGLKQGKALIR